MTSEVLFFHKMMMKANGRWRIRSYVYLSPELDWMRKAMGINKGVNPIGIKAA